ncbi:hypothetical protein Fcan01_15323 [Folsomia candida]|uniref:Uncharacterized protein n=1 Tax=Folsomia candida TaxID=158441 RepID=A0A226DUM9_FOLCA|nr:hypothetical protein Fcan01_15323 [Folsomia candida]
MGSSHVKMMAIFEIRAQNCVLNGRHKKFDIFDRLSHRHGATVSLISPHNTACSPLEVGKALGDEPLQRDTSVAPGPSQSLPTTETLIDSLVNRLDAIINPSAPNVNFACWAMLNQKLSLLQSAFPDECKRSSNLEEEIDSNEVEHREELEYLENQRGEDLEDIKRLEEKLKEAEENQQEMQQIRKELKDDTLFLTKCVRELSSAPEELLSVQPLTATAVATAIREAKAVTLQASPPPKRPRQ